MATRRISKAGKAAISRAAKRRWRAWRQAKKAGNRRLMKKIRGW